MYLNVRCREVAVSLLYVVNVMNQAVYLSMKGVCLVMSISSYNFMGFSLFQFMAVKYIVCKSGYKSLIYSITQCTWSQRDNTVNAGKCFQ